MPSNDTRYVSYPFAVQYETRGSDSSKRGKTPLNQLLWGDWTQVKRNEGNWVFIRSRGRNGWVRKESLQENPILEVNFVDIGQGDGCHIQTPEDKSIIIDAGEGDNMYRFLRWRFGKFKNDYTFESFVITHPDKDHYLGFSDLFEHEKVHVRTLYHNSIVEQMSNGKSTLGTKKKVGRNTYLTGLVQTKEQLKKITDTKARRGRRFYPNMLKKAVDSGRVEDIVGLLACRDGTADQRGKQTFPGGHR